MLYAHLTNATSAEKTAGFRFTVRICDSMSPIGGTVYRVANRKDAAKVAADMNAKRWNF